jgi:hypothetical protein
MGVKWSVREHEMIDLAVALLWGSVLWVLIGCCIAQVIGRASDLGGGSPS